MTPCRSRRIQHSAGKLICTRGSRIDTCHAEHAGTVRADTRYAAADARPERLNLFGSRPGLQINDINEVSISRTTGGDMGVHAESHMTEAEIRENEMRLWRDRRGQEVPLQISRRPSLLLLH